MFCAKLLSWVESQFSKNFHKIKSNNRLLKIFAPTKTVVLHCTNGRTRVQNYRVNQMCKLDLDACSIPTTDNLHICSMCNIVDVT